MNSCNFCNGNIESIIDVDVPILAEEVKTNLSVWVDEDLLTLSVEGAAVNELPEGDVINLQQTKIKYCPMCGRKLVEDAET